MEFKQLTKENVTDFISSHDTFMFDCDGVLWEGNHAFPGVKESLDELRKLGKRIIFVTNNSYKSTVENLQKFEKLGIHATKDEVYGTALILADYMKNVLNFKEKVYMLGSPGMSTEFDIAGIEHNLHGPEPGPGTPIDAHMKFEKDPEVKCVAVGMDQYISYYKVFKAASYLKDPNCLFLATNTDTFIPSSNGYVIPGTGTIVAFVETAAGRKPILVGKPHSPVIELLQKKHNLIPSRTVMFGDRLETDILLATNNNLSSVMTLTGVASLDEVKGHQESQDPERRKLIPNYWLNSFGDLIGLMKD